MAVTPTQSNEYSQFATEPRGKIDSGKWNSKLRASYAKYTNTSSGTGEVPVSPDTAPAADTDSGSFRGTAAVPPDPVTPS